ncbi:MAG: YegS/Rv2252/BmrU family lipid kinase [Saprospiraceae bacterium]
MILLSTNIKNYHSIGFYTEYAGHANKLTREACERDADLIVAVGGDGTFNEVINGVLASRKNDVGIAFIPNGTGNDFCSGQKITFNLEKFLKGLEFQRFRSIDAGMIQNSDDETRYFVNIADIGFGGHTTHLLNQQRANGLKGGLSYSVAIFRAFLNFKKPEVKIISDGKLIYEGRLMMLTFCNGDRFANGLIIHPGAKPDDGLLNLTLLGDVNLWDYISNIGRLKKGKLIVHPSITYHETKTIHVDIIKGKALIETDGEVFGSGSISVTVLTNAIKLLEY